MLKFSTYLKGFILSLFLTLTAYVLVSQKIIAKTGILTAVILALAIIQLIIQLRFFLHLNFQKEGRMNMLFLLSTLTVVLIVVVGSLWIMNHLNYNMTPDREIIQDEGFKVKH